MIRPARETDLPAMREIYVHEVLNGIATFDTEPRTLEQIRAWLLGHGERYPSLVAVSEKEGAEEVIGFAALYPWSPRKAYDATAENTIYLRHDCQGQGTGKRLLEALLNDARAKGFHTVIARISSENIPSVKFHERMGFAKIGTIREVGNKFGRLLDVDIMQLMLKERPGK